MLVGVVPAVAELDQLLVGELEVPHGAGHSFHLMRQLSLLARGFNVRSYSLRSMTHCTALAMTLQFAAASVKALYTYTSQKMFNCFFNLILQTEICL